ncbi:MAG: hypothetical protein LM523_09565 [Candidatus Contendobacter sp.]|nr:hypothetical protein [Candidatus Contendobacter sp.]
MSDPRIALVAEGPTDFIVIEAALRAILNRTFILSQLQPEPTRPEMGGGWGGVFKWCQQFRLRGATSIEADPTLANFDSVIMHLDADVADKSYADCGNTAVQAAIGLQALPCSRPCPPPSDTVKALEAVLLSWLNIPAIGPKSLFCIPSKATDAWLASAVLPQGHTLLAGLECNPNLETGLAQLPKAQRIRKSIPQYRSVTGSVVSQWQRVKTHCTQAAVFEQQVQTIAQAFPT